MDKLGVLVALTFRYTNCRCNSTIRYWPDWPETSAVLSAALSAGEAAASLMLAKNAPAAIHANVMKRKAFKRLEVPSFSSCLTVSERAMMRRLQKDNSGEVSRARTQDESSSVESRSKMRAEGLRR